VISLNFLSGTVGLNKATHPWLQCQLELQFPQSELQQLESALISVYQGTETEARLLLPSSWTVYFKKRDSDSQLFLAHPAPDTWVATCALNPALAEALVLAVQDLLGTGTEFHLSRLKHVGKVNRLSNLEVLIKK
jgi:hypothetical protein